LPPTDIEFTITKESRMSNLRRSFIGATVYLAVIFVLGQTDYTGRPIINFASYFYLAVMVAVPVTFLVPGIAKMSWLIPLAIWAGIYIVILQTISREHSANPGEFSVIVLEFILLELGVWLAQGLAQQLSHAESIMDAMALSAFPNRVHEIDSEDQRIKIELTRSRRYSRPLSLVIIATEPEDQKLTKEMLKSMQHDLMHRFTAARIGQIIDDRVRQTDLVLRDHHGHFVILCPETDLGSATLLGRRIAQSVKERTDVDILCGVAAFPEEALTFDDLVRKARERLTHMELVEELQPAVATPNEN